MKIIIIGAGISGCTAYLQLKKHLPGLHEITIYEAHDTNKDTTFQDREAGLTHSSALIVGGGLGVGPNGLNVIKRLDEDLLRDIVRGGYVVATSNLKSKSGRVLMRIDSRGDSTPGEEPMHMLASSRHSLWRCLRTRVPDSDIITKRVKEVIANPEGRNTISFTDGSDPIEADLVIGADGLKSIVKLALFPEAKEDPYPPHYEGLVGIGGFIPSDSVKEHVEPGSMNFVFGGNGFFGYFFTVSDLTAPDRDSPYTTSEPGDTLSWWSTYAIDECPDARSIDREDIVRQLRERHADWKDPVIQGILRSLRVENMYPTWTSPQLPTWERNGVVLVGDAAHALPSSSGQGSSQALEDVESFVLFLSHYLREDSSDDTVARKSAITSAAKQYMELRRPRIELILEEARRRQDSKRNMGVVEEHLMYLFMWMFGLFSNRVANSAKAVASYNVAEDVDRILKH